GRPDSNRRPLVPQGEAASCQQTTALVKTDRCFRGVERASDVSLSDGLAVSRADYVIDRLRVRRAQLPLHEQSSQRGQKRDGPLPCSRLRALMVSARRRPGRGKSIKVVLLLTDLAVG